VVILKEVKVVCFVTLLQVLILNEMEEGSGIVEKQGNVDLADRLKGRALGIGLRGNRVARLKICRSHRAIRDADAAFERCGPSERGDTRSGWGKEGGIADTVNRTLARDYRIRYYSSSEKLKTVN
jgi:hypothetical protein